MLLMANIPAFKNCFQGPSKNEVRNTHYRLLHLPPYKIDQRRTIKTIPEFSVDSEQLI